MAYTTIDDPTKYFDTTIWTGSGGAKTITGLNHKPDLIWTKTRSVGYNHMWSDSSRGFGANSEIGSNSTAAQGGLSAETYGYKSGHTADGWTMVDGSDSVDSQEDGNTNQPGVTYVGWTWAANGGTTVSNSSGDITSTVQANTTAGFSIVTYNGNGSSNQTVGHGLGATPDILIWKNYDTDTSGWKWDVWCSHFGNTNILRLDQTTAKESSNGDVDALPTSTLFTVGNNGSTNGQSGQNHTIICYAFAEKQGYSKFGGYTGNGNANGSFIHTGFKPAWIMIKCTSESSRNWVIYDNKRETFNEQEYFIRAQNSGAEQRDDGYSEIDLLSNGFKLRGASGDTNKSSATYIYLAFAENPFVSSKGVPTTAR